MLLALPLAEQGKIIHGIQNMSTIQIAATPAEINACHAVMAQLRPQYAQDEFLAQVQRQMKHGYHLACLSAAGSVQAVAGFRLLENLAWGRFLYVDDLVTDQNSRSQGHGKALLNWLNEHARRQGCAQLHLDSGAQRKDAHRFYLREGMKNSGFHFMTKL